MLLITICARGGSKGIPGKNIKSIAGKPLIAYTIETAQKFAALHNGIIQLSTDDEQIIEVAAQWGLETNYRRPADLASDTAGKMPVIANALEHAERRQVKPFDFIIDMDVTSPLRSVKDLETALALLQQRSEAMNIFSVSKAHRNPYFNMVEEKGDGFVKLVKPGQFLTRQSAPKVYDMNASFYIFRRVFFDGAIKPVINDLSMAYEVPHPCFDLDEPLDFHFMEYLMNSGEPERMGWIH